MGMASSRGRTRFLLIISAFVLVALLTHRNPWLVRRLSPLDQWTAQVTASVLEECGMEVEQQDAVLSHPTGFGYEIYYRCTGLLPAAFLAVAVLAVPASGRRKLAGIALGVPLVFLLNLARLVSLFYIGVSYPGAFTLMHQLVWEAVVAGFVVGYWLWWMRAASMAGAVGGRRGDGTPQFGNGHLSG